MPYRSSFTVAALPTQTRLRRNRRATHPPAQFKASASTSKRRKPQRIARRAQQPQLQHRLQCARRYARPVSLLSIFNRFLFMKLQNPFPVSPVYSHRYKTPGVSPSCIQISGFSPSLCLCVSVPLWQILRFAILGHSLVSSENSTPLQSSNSTLFAQNTRGWGVSPHSRASVQVTKNCGTRICT
jgi:hypothetical protein